MATAAYVNVKVDSNVKERAREVLDSLGLDMTTAINMFLRQVVRCDGIPFEVSNRAVTPPVDPRLIYRPLRNDAGLPVLPASWDDRGDDVYDNLYPGH